MGEIIVQKYTTTNPISMMGEFAGLCWSADVDNPDKNFKRGLDCIQADHGRVLEYPQIYLILDGYSARVIREFYTHICDNPTRLQASTRYINYSNFDYIMPPHAEQSYEAKYIYQKAMEDISGALQDLDNCGIPREDIGMLLPLGMTTKIVYRGNLRALINMSRKRLCARAYWEYRQLMKDIVTALSEYSEEWKYLVETEKVFVPQCEVLGYCPETYSCGKEISKEEFKTALEIYKYVKTNAPHLADGTPVAPMKEDKELMSELWNSRASFVSTMANLKLKEGNDA